MGYLTNFDWDVFISYAHFDNDRYDPPEKQGWVEGLHQDLQQRVRVHLGGQPALWRDDQIGPSDDWEKIILDRLVKTATFLAVVSPSFLERKWCIRELDEFTSWVGPSVRVDDGKTRIFKVEKVQVDLENLPATLPRTGSYKFYEKHEFRPIIGGQIFQAYFDRMDELARDIADVLRALAKKPPELAAPGPGTTVFLAETTSDLAEQHNQIRQELKSKGHLVLPNESLPSHLPELQIKVREYLQRSTFSIHLIGTNYGVVPDGEQEKSKAWLQNDLAIERSNDPAFKRFIWVSSEGVSDTRQRKFLQYLRDNPDAQRASQFLENKPLGKLKELIDDNLAAMKTNGKEPELAGNTSSLKTMPVAGNSGQPPTVYVICDQMDRDQESLKSLEQFLRDMGYNPILPSQSADEKGAMQQHCRNLETCDATIIYYGQASDRWLYAKRMDFMKYLSRRRIPVLAKMIYVAPPDTVSKQTLQVRDVTVLRGEDPFSPEALEPFTKLLSSAHRLSA